MAKSFAPLLVVAVGAFASSLAYIAPPQRRLSLRGGSQQALAHLAQPETLSEGSAEEAASTGSALRSVVSACAAMLLLLAPLQAAEAARSGGRMGGGIGTFRSSGPAARAPMARSATSTTTNVVVRGGYSPFGYGYGMPMVFPSPFAFGFGGGYGPSSTDQQLANQQRQDERQMDAQAQEIQALKQQLAELKVLQKN